MTLGQFSEIFFMLALPFFTKRFGIKKVLLLGLVTAAIRYGFFIYGSADEYFTYALLFLGILLHGVSYDFTTLPLTSMSIKSPRAYAYRRAGADHALLPGLRQFARLSSWRCDDGKDVRLSGTGKRTDFQLGRDVDFWRGDDCHYRRAVHDFFRESDNEITAIKVDDRDITLTQGEVK